MLHHYLFTDLLNGDEFIVEAPSFIEADRVASEHYPLPRFEAYIPAMEVDWYYSETPIIE